VVAAHSLTPYAVTPSSDEQRMLLYVSWKKYVIMRELLDGPSIRMTYIKGKLELRSPAYQHELWKKNIARLVEHHAFVRNIAMREDINDALREFEAEFSK